MNTQTKSEQTTGVIGHIQVLDGTIPPSGWVLCDGRSLAIDAQPALFACLGARFGGDGINTFRLPNLNDGKHRFAICLDGYFPRKAALPAEWQTAAAEQAFIANQVRAFRLAYRQGVPPLGQHTHVDDLDQEWLARQAQVLIDAYAQGRDPLHRHTPSDHIDPDWLARQVQVLHDAYEQGRDPFHRHVSHDHLDPEWLDKQAQILIDEHARHSHPLHRHDHADNLDPDWLRMQVQSLLDAYERNHDPHHRHPHSHTLDDEWLSEQIHAHDDVVETDETPVSQTDNSPTDDLRRIEGIGPRVAGLLAEAGIDSFAALANSQSETLRALLQEAQLFMIKPDTWPEQAALAAAGDWDTLSTLQDELRGGSR